MLDVTDLAAGYGGVAAVRAVSLTVGEGKTVALLGPNGAGKTTTLLCIAGWHKPDAGEIRWQQDTITTVSTQRRVARGIALVPEGRHLFPELSVVQNLSIGHSGTRRPTRSLSDFLDWVFEVFPILAERRRLSASSLSGGEQQMLAIARALASEPGLLMLDEPSLGLAPSIVAQVYDILGRLRETTQLSILIVEQYVAQALSFADTAYIMRGGSIVGSGSAAELNDNKALVESYLGGP